jgi:hypothetical protein
MATLPLAELVFIGHVIQVEESIAPGINENFPCVHCKQLTDPFTSLYVPGTHNVQTPPSGPVHPALHVQAVIDELEFIEFVFKGHRTQTLDVLDPTIPEYVPASHPVQVAAPTSIEYPPAGQS